MAHNVPSVETIMAQLGRGLEKEHGKEAKAKAEAIRTEMQRVQDIVDSAWHWTREVSDEVDKGLAYIGKILCGYGTEHLGGRDRSLLYVNMGDSYCPTVLFDVDNEHFIISSWGDFVERPKQRRFFE